VNEIRLSCFTSATILLQLCFHSFISVLIQYQKYWYHRCDAIFNEYRYSILNRLISIHYLTHKISLQIGSLCSDKHRNLFLYGTFVTWSGYLKHFCASFCSNTFHFRGFNWDRNHVLSNRYFARKYRISDRIKNLGIAHPYSVLPVTWRTRACVSVYYPNKDFL